MTVERDDDSTQEFIMQYEGKNMHESPDITISGARMIAKSRKI